VVTQFSFAPNRIVEYCADLARRLPDIPIYVGLAGPTNPVALLRFAQRCGVSASLRALQAEGMRAVRLFTHVDPSDQLIALARHARAGSASNVVGVHLFSFGGVARTAQWMNQRITARAKACTPRPEAEPRPPSRGEAIRHLVRRVETPRGPGSERCSRSARIAPSGMTGVCDTPGNLGGDRPLNRKAR
jgi:hypothetical protein